LNLFLILFLLLSTFFQYLVATSKENVSPVIEYLPVSPVAPPNKIALPL
jgi:hypothetical protein